MWERHDPMVVRAQPGAVRVWAEPETGAESYIPWAMDRRGRATDVLAYTANAFGYELAPKARPAAFVGSAQIGGRAEGVGVVNIHLHGTTQQLLDQVVRQLDQLRRQGRLPVAVI